jgi:serine/threonine protein phosphatase 1
MMYNIIGDIAGQFDALEALIKKMPPGEIISVGDMIDRGPDSRKVVEFFMNGGGTALLGNHEHMCLDHYQRNGNYERGVWYWNGGEHTDKSWPDGRVPENVISWFSSLPTYREIKIDDKEYLISHAFINWNSNGLEAEQMELLWNRRYPIPNSKYHLQICGHNSQFGLRYWSDAERQYAVCIDSSRDDVLTGIHLPTGTIYQQSYDAGD